MAEKVTESSFAWAWVSENRLFRWSNHSVILPGNNLTRRKAIYSPQPQWSADNGPPIMVRYDGSSGVGLEI
jgi:hypothetical protein